MNEVKTKWYKKFLTKGVFITLVALVVVVAVAIGTITVLRTDRKVTKLGFEDIGELATQAVYYTQVGLLDEDRELFTKSIPRIIK